MPHQVGQEIDLVIKRRYVAGDSEVPGKVLYEPDTDRMQSRYEKYIFDRDAFVATFGDVNGPKNDGWAKVRINEASKTIYAGDAGGAAPVGGFNNWYYHVTLVSGGANASATDDE